MGKKIWIFLIMLFCLVSEVKAEVLKIPLSKFVPVTSFDLKCIKGEYKIPIPLPERWKVKSATISIGYINSINLVNNKSQLVVKLNGETIGQVKLDPLAPEGKMELSIPLNILKSGYNNLSFHVAQHYLEGCEQFCAPDLWTTVKLDNSPLEIEYDLKPVPLKLSEASNFLFDPKIFPAGEVNIITENTSSEIISITGIAASGVARRFDYRKVFFTTSNDIKHGYDNIIIGGKEFVENFLKKKNIEVEILGPFLKIMHIPGENGKMDALHGMLIVSGTNLADVKIAAETLANITIPYPGTDEMIAKQLNLPDISLYSGRQILTSNKAYAFKTLNVSTHTFEGFNIGSIDITFRLPVDFLIKPNQYAKLVLNFTYGAGMRNDSVLNIILNDKVVKVIHLKESSGAYIEGYRIDLPTYLFKVGSNTIKLAPILNPAAKECDLIRPDGYFLTIFENSTLYFPPMPHLVEMPRIELFMVDSFPFTRRPDGYESTIYLTQSDYEVIDSALNLIGLITQKNGYPLFGIKITFEKPNPKDKEFIVLGRVDTIPDDFLSRGPLKLTKESIVSYPVIRGWEAESSFALSKQISGIGPDAGVVMEFQSPYKRGRSVLLLTANSTNDLSALSQALLEPGVQSQMKGDLVLIDLRTPPDYKVIALDTGKKFFTGKAGKISLISYYFYVYPYAYYITIVLLILLLSLALFFFLRKIRDKRIQLAKGDAPKGN